MTALGTLFIYPHLPYNPQDEIHWLEMEVHIQSTICSKEENPFSFSIAAEVSNMHSRTQNSVLLTYIKVKTLGPSKTFVLSSQSSPLPLARTRAHVVFP